MPTISLKKDDERDELVETLVSLIEARDPFLRGHAERVAATCASFSAKLELPERDIKNMYLAGLLHNLGMIYLPDELLQWPGRLNEEEWKLVKGHPLISEKILSKNRALKGILPIIRQHHEAFDGSGYPRGLKGEEIHLGARILGIADAYHALTSPRPQRKGMGAKKALQELKKHSGGRFDPHLVQKFIQYVHSVSGIFQDSGAGEAAEPIKKVMLDTIQEFKEGKIKLPHLPRIVNEIQSVAFDPESTVDDLARVIERDGVISMKLISLANSSWYRRMEEIYSVRRAIPLLGFRETQGIIMAIAYRDLYEVKDLEYGVVMENLWIHSLASAHGAAALAKRLAHQDADRYFLLGLLHDIGKVPLLRVFSERRQMLRHIEMGTLLSHIERIYPIISEEILRRWKFGEDAIRVIRFQAPQPVESDAGQDVRIVRLASRLSSYIGYGDGMDPEDVVPGDLDSAKVLGLSSEMLEETAAGVEEAVRRTARFM